MITEKAGCFLIKKETKEIALIYREKQKIGERQILMEKCS